MSLKSICVFMILECFYSLLLLLKKKVVFTVFYVYDYIIQSSEQRCIPILIVLKIASGSIAAYSCERILRRPIIRFQGILLLVHYKFFFC